MIHGDTLVNAIKNNYPDAFGTEYGTLPHQHYAARMMPVQLLLKKVIRNMGKDIGYRAKIFESCYLHPKTVAALAKEGPVILVFLVYGNFNLRKRIKDIRAYAETNQHCWSYEHDYESLTQVLEGLRHFSGFLRSECQRYGVEQGVIENDWGTEWTRLRDNLIHYASQRMRFL